MARCTWRCIHDNQRCIHDNRRCIHDKRNVDSNGLGAHRDHASSHEITWVWCKSCLEGIKLVCLLEALCHVYTEDAGLPYFHHAAVIANGNWYCDSALKSTGAKLCFRYCLVNIGPIYTY